MSVQGLSFFGSYYTRQGFQVVDDFNLPRTNKAPWLGTFLKMEV